MGCYNRAMGSKMLRRREVCDVLGVSVAKVRQLVDCGLLRPIRAPRCRAWFREVDVRRLANG
jgi:predicted site-specific integrase-resolvase